jgi:hypothetical protein
VSTDNWQLFDKSWDKTTYAFSNFTEIPDADELEPEWRGQRLGEMGLGLALRRPSMR